MEVEKALSGVGSGGESDSGLGDRMFGRLLEWLNDHETDVFFACTCNDISKIVASNPEFVRAGRFDGMFFFDMPQDNEREAIWNLYLPEYYHEEGSYNIKELVLASADWTGAEIESCCRLSAILEEPLLTTAESIVPVARTADSTLDNLRQWASGKCRSVRSPGLYKPASKGPAGANSMKKRSVKRRKVQRGN